jgi:hypothetical protein
MPLFSSTSTPCSIGPSLPPGQFLDQVADVLSGRPPAGRSPACMPKYMPRLHERLDCMQEEIDCMQVMCVARPRLTNECHYLNRGTFGAVSFVPFPALAQDILAFLARIGAKDLFSQSSLDSILGNANLTSAQQSKPFSARLNPSQQAVRRVSLPSKVNFLSARLNPSQHAVTRVNPMSKPSLLE